MGSRINSEVSLWNLYCFTETWGYTFKPPTRKMTERGHDVNEISFMCDLLIFSSRRFSYEFGNLSNCFWGHDLSLFALLRKLFGHFNLSILRISSHVKWEFFVNAKNVVVFFVVLCGGQMRHQNFHSVEDLVILFYFYYK